MSARDDETPSSRQLRVQIEGGPSFAMDAGEDSLLRGALRAGVTWPYECSVGGCGACRFELLEGQMDTLWPEAPGLSERERRRGKRLGCQSRPTSDCQVRVRCDTGTASSVAPRRTLARLRGRRGVTGDISEFTFEMPGQCDFLPGQYALLYAEGVPGARAYSMSNLPDGEHIWQFLIRRTPGGKGTAALFERLQPGDALPIDGPYGHAYLRDGPRDVVCIAGGSGLGPMLSVARGVLARKDPRRVLFFLGLRSGSDLGAARELAVLDPGRASVMTVLSDPGLAPAWDGPTGFVHDAVERALATPAGDNSLHGFDFYFAGPPPMVEAVQTLLMLNHRVPFDQIHFDRFI